ncbi:protein of unknown function [Pseudorhizobium banfieldiae]|uniref:Uncharacterized protein n=1 Tax=Pseudorhizobium banfieldiae TaxID=1125847 RepID=L0NE24_9HYPH|nr:protein of unknown function [Pseudorhizobium banfieldiae]
MELEKNSACRGRIRQALFAGLAVEEEAPVSGGTRGGGAPPNGEIANQTDRGKACSERMRHRIRNTLYADG